MPNLEYPWIPHISSEERYAKIGDAKRRLTAANLPERD
jgi:hypothetical protein